MKITEKSFALFHTISWTAIFSGVLTGFGINFLLNLITLAFGISIFNVDEGKMIFSMLGFCAYVIVSVFTMFMTGWVSGKLSPRVFQRERWGILIGFISWTMLLILTVIILMNMIQFVAFHSNFTSHPNLVAIRISNDLPMMTEAKEGQLLNSPIDINIEKTTKVITLNAYATLILFLLGAFSSCIGGYIGYGGKKIDFINKRKKTK